MKVLLIFLIFSVSQIAFSRIGRESVCSQPRESCALAHRVLFELSKHQVAGYISNDLNVEKLTEALRQGRVSINEEHFQQLGGVDRKVNLILKEMLSSSEVAPAQVDHNVAQLSNIIDPSKKLKSGTRGGTFDLPTESPE